MVGEGGIFVVVMIVVHRSVAPGKEMWMRWFPAAVQVEFRTAVELDGRGLV